MKMSIFLSLELHWNGVISGLRHKYFLSEVKRGGFDKAQQQHKLVMLSDTNFPNLKAAVLSSVLRAI